MKRLWKRLVALLFVLFVAAVALGVGFLVFASEVDAAAEDSRRLTPDGLPEADGIVVWTGPGGGRLQAGADVLAAGKGERLLISGVNGSNAREDILGVLELADELKACCVDLDYAAIDTVGNARETWAWVEALGYEHIILVTSAYHMPRAQVELGTKAGRIRVTPYAVSARDYSGWWREPALRERLAREYGKLLVSWFREPASEASRATPVVEIEVDG